MEEREKERKRKKVTKSIVKNPVPALCKTTEKF